MTGLSEGSNGDGGICVDLATRANYCVTNGALYSPELAIVPLKPRFVHLALVTVAMAAPEPIVKVLTGYRFNSSWLTSS